MDIYGGLSSILRNTRQQSRPTIRLDILDQFGLIWNQALSLPLKPFGSEGLSHFRVLPLITECLSVFAVE